MSATDSEQAARARAHELMGWTAPDSRHRSAGTLTDLHYEPLERAQCDRLVALLLDHARERERDAVLFEELRKYSVAAMIERDAALRDLSEARDERDRYLREVAMQRNALQDIAGEALFCAGTCRHWAGDRAIGPAHRAKETLERADRESWKAADGLLALTAERDQLRADLDAARARLDDAGRLLREQAMTLRQLCKAVEYEGLITCGGQQEEHETDECDGDGPEDAAHIVWEAAGRGWEAVEATRAFLAGATPPAPVQARLQSSGLTTTNGTDRELVAAMLAIPCHYCAATVGKPCAGERTFCMDRFTRRFDLTAGTKPAPVQAETEYCEHGTPVELTDMCTGCKATPSAAAPVRDGGELAEARSREDYHHRRADRLARRLYEAHEAIRWLNQDGIANVAREQYVYDFQVRDEAIAQEREVAVPPSPHLDSAPPKEEPDGR